MASDTEKVKAAPPVEAAKAVGNVIGSMGITGISLVALLAMQIFTMMKDSSEETKAALKETRIEVSAVRDQVGSILTTVSVNGVENNSRWNANDTRWDAQKDSNNAMQAAISKLQDEVRKK